MVRLSSKILLSGETSEIFSADIKFSAQSIFAWIELMLGLKDALDVPGMTTFI